MNFKRYSSIQMFFSTILMTFFIKKSINLIFKFEVSRGALGEPLGWVQLMLGAYEVVI